MTASFLSMKSISKHYGGVKALNTVDFEINRGEIHCLAGENGSGKSTLIKIISGVVSPDAGAHIEIGGERFQNYQAIDSIHKGIEVIYQDLSLFPNLTVAENIALSHTIAAGHQFVNQRTIRQVAHQAMARIGIKLPLDELVSDISLADQQLVAICRALTSDVKLVIMDEPTTALTKKEVEALFAVVKDMQTKGIATMFVSHKLNEVLQIAERVTILRDGKKVGTFAGHELDSDKLTMLMTGKKIEYTQYAAPTASTQPLLTVKNLSKRGNFKDISFSLHPGEILGITGLLGSGRTELALALFGLNRPDSGQILIEGQPVTINSVQDAVKLGIGYVPENRLVQGLVMPQAVGKNIMLTTLPKVLNKFRLIDAAKMRAHINRWVSDLSIKIPAVDAPVQTLSGGNQQRVVLAKWMAIAPKILILDGPTVGVDVAAKSTIHDIIRGLTSRGVAAIIISDEVPEALHNSNRLMVMHKGKFLAEFVSAQTTEEQIQQRINMAG